MTTSLIFLVDLFTSSDVQLSASLVCFHESDAAKTTVWLAAVNEIQTHTGGPGIVAC